MSSARARFGRVFTGKLHHLYGQHHNKHNGARATRFLSSTLHSRVSSSHLTSISVHSRIPHNISHDQKRYHMVNSHHHVSEKGKELAKQCERVTKLGVYSNVGLALLKGTAGVMTNSMALIADATHTFTDLLSDFMTFATIKYSQSEPTRKYPLGFGKIDTLGTLPVAGLLIGGSFYIMKSSFTALLSGSTSALITMPQVALGCVVLSLVVKEWMYRITMKAGTEYNSSVTIANALHHRTDAFSSMIALIGVGGAWMGYPVLDPICGIIIGGYFVKIGSSLLKSAFEQLLDRNSDRHWNVVKDIIDECNIDGIKGVHELVVTQSGQYVHINCGVMVDRELSMDTVEKILDEMRVKLRSNDSLNIQQLALVPIVYHQDADHPHHYQD